MAGTVIGEVTQKPKKPTKPSFYVAFQRLMDEYQIVDWAVVARKKDLTKYSAWMAGSNTNPFEDRDRQNDLYAEMARLQSDILKIGK